MWRWDNAGCVTFATPQSVLLFVLVLEQVLHLRSLQPRQHRAGRQHLTSDSAYGLGGAVWTRDINRALRVARGVETGRMWVNTYNAIPEGAPFGGCKASGIGRETHKVILEHYTQMKNIMINMAEAPTGFYPA